MRNLEGYQAGIHHSPLKFTSHGKWASHRRCQGFLVIRHTCSVSSYFHESHRLFIQGIVTSSGEQAEQQILKRSLCFSQSGVCRVGGKELEIFGCWGQLVYFAHCCLALGCPLDA